MAGLPPCFWSYAAPCFCVNFNITQIRDDTKSPWEFTHGEPFLGQRFPFGCLVWFLPSSTKPPDEKWAPKARVGVFAGYRIHEWSRSTTGMG